MRRSIRKISKQAGVLLFFILAAFVASAQNTVNGTVTDSKLGNGIPAVTVTIRGTKTATQTDVNGQFSIKASPNSTLVFTSAGYTPKEVAVGNQSSLQVSMAVAVENLNEVVVIGYGTTKKKDLTGSVSTVSTKDFQKGSVTTPEQLISGKVSGVSITSNGGAPGSGSVIRIRGGASLTASNNPLIVVDGVPLSNGVNGDGTPLAGAANGLNLINPNDIETFTILKDAAATAIYGSRASNGVILITTKHGKSGKPTLNFSTQLGVSKLPKEYPVLSADQFRTYVKANGTPAQIALLGGANTDWQKEIYQSALTTDNNLSLTGSIKKVPYRISGEYLDQQGILKTDDLKRFSGGLNLTPRFFKNTLKVELNLHGTVTNTRFANQGAIGNAISFDPSQPVYSKGSKFGGYYEWLGANDSTLNNNSNRNPVAMLEQNNGRSDVQRSFGNIQLDYSLPFITGLHANLNLGYDIAKGDGSTFIPANAAQSYNNGIDSLRGYNTPYLQKYINKTGEFYLNYNKDFSSIKSNINAVAGYGYYDNLTKNYSYTQRSATNAIRTDLANNPPLYFYSPSDYTLISYYGRLIYTFNEKYVLMGSIRTDGSSRFSPGTRWGTFPSAAFTWRMKQEDFLKTSNTLSQLNLRLSYGKTGNQDGIGLYGYIPTYFLSTPGSLYPFGNTFYNMYTPSAYISNLTWETTGTYDAGFDYGFLDNRINGSIDYYYKKTTDLLANVSVPSGSNFSNKETTNIGSMTDQGIDFNVNLIPVRNKDWDWEVGFNASYNKFQITNLTLVPDPKFIGNATGGISGGTGNTAQLDAVGSAPNTFYLYQQIYDAKGKPIEGLYVDQNRDGIINQNDLVKNKSPYPIWTLGFSNSLSYQKWSLNFVMRANLGNYMYNNTASNLAVTRSIITPNGYLGNAPSSVLNSSFTNNQYFSDYYLENASFLRMDNIGLVYNLGSISKTQNNNLKVSFNCQNVFVITKYTGVDPEIYSGIDNNFYPHPRIFTLGLNLSL